MPHRYRGRFAEDLAEKAPDVYATLRAQEELVVGVLEAQARAKDEKGRAPQKQKKLREALGALRTPSLVETRGVPCPLDPDVMISGLHAPSTSPTMFKSALTPSLVGFTVRRPQTTAAPPQTPPPPPPRKRAPSTARLGVPSWLQCVMLHAFDAPHIVHAGRRLLRRVTRRGLR